MANKKSKKRGNSFEELLIDKLLYLADNPNDVSKLDAKKILDATNQLKESLENRLNNGSNNDSI